VPSCGTIPELRHVAKVSAEKLWNRNLKQSNRCAKFSESTLRTSA
jgi:hypothetical protein